MTIVTPIWYRAANLAPARGERKRASKFGILRFAGWRMKRSVRLVIPRKLSEVMGYQKLIGSGSDVAVVVGNGNGNDSAVLGDGDGDAISSWKTWLALGRKRDDTALRQPKKKRPSWLPDPRHRWPQGWDG